ncbi:MAG: DEAD/DEAH box helicase [Methanomassiliicoccales archaeon]
MAERYMHVNELNMEGRFLRILQEMGIHELYPTQEKTIPSVLKGRNVVAAVPTASGKSLIGYAALLRAFGQGNKGLYVAPLRALAAEKYAELKAFEREGIRLALATGDLDSTGESLRDRDIIIATSEKADSLMRHSTSWIRNVSALVIDEIHLLNDPRRGPTLEMIISKFRELNPGIQIVGLSATIKNSIEIANWLEAEHYSSEWRPVRLREGVYCSGEVFFTDNERRRMETSNDELWGLIENSVKNGGQVLVFVNTRKNAENAAMKYKEKMRRLSGETGLLLEEDMEEQNALTERINACVGCGVGFHHAGLTSSQRSFLERQFRERKISCLFATPTLAAGINLPARTVIVRDIHRFEESGMTLIPIMEVKQMLGRAGRPKYDSYGEAIVYARNEDMARIILDEYLLGEPEAISSQLGNASVLRTHVLASIATRMVVDREGLVKLFGASFYAHQFERDDLLHAVDEALEYLSEHGMVVVEGEELRTTLFGKRVSDLYIDPASAVIMREALERYSSGKLLGILHAVCSTPDLNPLFVNSSEAADYADIAEERRDELIFPIEDSEDPDIYLSQLKTALLLNDWISEEEESRMLEKYGIYPGDLREKCETAKWLVNALYELSSLLHLQCEEDMEMLAKRIEKGVSERLLDLASLRGVGRRRARQLFLHGLRSRADIAASSLQSLMDIPGIGRELASSLIAQCTSARSPSSRSTKTEGGETGKWFF